MAIRIGSKRFPDTFPEILSDKDFTLAFGEFLKKRDAFENLQFYVAVERGVKPASLYQNFISTMARKQINIGAEDRIPMDNLAAQNNFDPGTWRTHLNTAQVEIYNVMNTNFYTAFFKSDAYLKLMERTVIPTIKSVPSNVLGNAKLKDNKTLVKDKNLLACIKYTKLSGVLKEKGHPKASGVKKLASSQFEALGKKHKFSMKYDQWEKIVGMSI